MMLTVQTRMRSVEVEVRNGSSQRRYHGKTTGAHNRDAAMGQAKASGESLGAVPRTTTAVTNPTKIANAASKRGVARLSSAANTGPLKRKPCTYTPSEPNGMRP